MFAYNATMIICTKNNYT